MTVPDPTRSAADAVATVVLSVLTALIGAASVAFSGFFVMATDSCGARDCNESRLGQAYWWTWGGVALAALIAVVGILVARRRRRTMWVWPALALVVVIAAFAVGAALASSIPNG